MLGLGGFGGQGMYGMGIELGFRYPAKAGMKHARHDYRQLRMEAGRTDKALATSMAGMKRGFRMMTLGGGIGAAVVGVSALNMKTEQSLADIKSLGASSSEVRRLGREFHNMMMLEDLPVNLRNAEGSLYDMLSAGIQFGDVNATMREASFLAKGTMGDISDSAKIMGISYEKVFANMEGTTEQKAKRIADIFAATVRTYRTKLPGLAKEFGEIAGDIPSNWTMDQVVPMIGTLYGRYEGMTGARMRAIINKLPTAQKTLGLDFANESGMAKDPLEIIRMMKKKFGAEIDMDEQQLLIKAFGQEVMGAVVSLLELEGRYVEGRHLAKQHGLAQSMAADRMDTLSGKLEITGNKFKLLGNTIGDNGIELKKWAGNLNDLVASTDQFFQKNPGSIEAGTGIGGILAAFLGGAGLIKVMTSAAGQWSTLAPILTNPLAWGAAGAGSSLYYGNKLHGAYIDSLATLGKPIPPGAEGLSYVAPPEPHRDHWMDKMIDQSTSMAMKGNLFSSGIGLFALQQGVKLMASDKIWRSQKWAHNFTPAINDRWDELNARPPGAISPPPGATQPKVQQTFTGEIKPTLVLHLSSDDPDYIDRVKKSLSDIMQEAAMMAMRKGESPTELAQ